jgi:phenylalanyl-tRNA synthetase beta chain
MANSLTTPDYVQLSENLKEAYNVTMLNPLSHDLSAMRQSLLFSGLEAVSYNINRKNGDLKLFEFGKSYHKMPSGYEEQKHLTLFLSGNRQNENWNSTQKPSDFFLFRGYIETLFSRLALPKTQTVPVNSDFFGEGIALGIGQDNIVEFGTVKKSILKHFDIKQDVFYADFNWGMILKLLSTKIKFQEIPKYPEVRRDFALLVDNNITFESLYNSAKQTEKTFLKEVNLFDVYQGGTLPEGKKSYALSFIIQDNSKTLTEEQIDKIMNKLKGNFEKDFDAVLR